MTAVCGDILDQTGAYIFDETGAYIWDELGPCDHSVAVESSTQSEGSGGYSSLNRRREKPYTGLGPRDATYISAEALLAKQVEPAEIKADAVEPKRAEPAPTVPLFLDKLIANQAANPADELRAREIERQLQMMRDDDEAVALLLLN